MITHNKKYNYRYHSDGVSGTVMVIFIKIITIIPSNDDDDDDDNDNNQALIIQYKTSTVYFLELPLINTVSD